MIFLLLLAAMIVAFLSSPISFPLVLFFASAAADAASFHDAPDFCSQTLSRTGCAAPPTYDSLIIHDYLGKWYEIGGTAVAKLQKSAGLACYQSSYSLAAGNAPAPVKRRGGDGGVAVIDQRVAEEEEEDDDDDDDDDGNVIRQAAMGEGVKVHIEERGMARLGMAEKLGVMRLSSAARGVCSSARRICAGAAMESELRDWLYQVSGVMVEISAEHADEASLLSNAIVTISKSLQRVQIALHHLAGNVSSIQIINGLLSHGPPKQKQQQQEDDDRHHHDQLIEDLNKSIRKAMSLHLQLAVLLTSDIQSACDSILRVAYSLISNSSSSDDADDPASPPSPSPASKLLLSTRSIRDQINAMLSALSRMELELIAMSAASSSISAAGAAAADSCSSSSSSSSPPPQPEPVSIAGQAVQNASSPGKLVVSMEGGFSGPYWIIGLEGSPSHGYDASLVYSCVQESTGSGADGDVEEQLQESLFILSRTPLQRSRIDTFLASAKLLGISTLCDNPFLLTLQDCDI